MLKRLHIALCIVLFLAVHAAFGQAPEKLTLRFRLQLEPPFDTAVGNDHSAVWKISYKIRIVDALAYEASKGKQARKTGKPKLKTVKKGKFRRKSLDVVGNRTVSQDVYFTGRVLERLKSDSPQLFLISVKFKACSNSFKKSSAGMGGKKRCMSQRIRPGFELRADQIKYLKNSTMGFLVGVESGDETGVGTFVFLDY